MVRHFLFEHVRMACEGIKVTLECYVSQAISRAPPWDLANMLAVMKNDMSSTLHKSAVLSRCHQQITAALKHRDRQPGLPAAIELAGSVSSLLMLLPLPGKSDQGMPCLCATVWMETAAHGCRSI